MGKAIAEKIPTLNSFSSARNKGKRPQVLYWMEDLDLDGIHLRVLKEHKHEIAELLAKVCSCHYEETLCLVRRALPVSLPSTKTTWGDSGADSVWISSLEESVLNSNITGSYQEVRSLITYMDKHCWKWVVLSH